MRYRILAVASALLVAGGVIVAGAQQAGAQQEFTLVAHQTNFVYDPVDGPATVNPGPTAVPSIGDRIIMRETLSENGAPVGFDNIICTETFNYDGLCDVVLAISGKGDIHATALVRDVFYPNGNGPSVFDATIDGGTFAYANATGYSHLSDLPNGDTQQTFLLS